MSKSPTEPSGQTRHRGSDQAPQEGEFRLTRTWVVIGILAVLFGLAAGLLMSTSWLR